METEHSLSSGHTLSGPQCVWPPDALAQDKHSSPRPHLFASERLYLPDEGLSHLPQWGPSLWCCTNALCIAWNNLRDLEWVTSQLSLKSLRCERKEVSSWTRSTWRARIATCSLLVPGLTQDVVHKQAQKTFRNLGKMQPHPVLTFED